MALINTMEQLEVAHTEIMEVAETIRTKVANASNVDDLNIDAKGERELIERTIGDLAKVSANQLAALKTRLNTLLPINRLPIETFTHIILLTGTWAGGDTGSYRRHPYMRYTWVCHRWRSALIQNSAFWTVIQHKFIYGRELTGPMVIYEELFRRTKSAQVDIRLSEYSVPFIPTLQKLFTEESHRIYKLWLHDKEGLIQLVSSGKQYPSLQRLAVHEAHNMFLGQRFIHLAPVFAASDFLETLQCTLGDDVPFDRLCVIFRRIRHLDLTINSLAVAPPVLEMLHDSPKLQTLQLLLKNYTFNARVEVPRQVVLPELQFVSTTHSVLAFFQAPRLSSLRATCDTTNSNPVALAFELDFLSIRFLYIRGPRSHRECTTNGLCILGTKERVCCESLFSQKRIIFDEDPFTQECSHDCFHLGYGSNNRFATEFATVLQEMSMILPRLTSLVELHFLIPHSLDEFEALISDLPSVEKLVVQRGNKLLDVIHFLNKTPLPCPQLKYLYFKTFAVPRGIKKYANDVGRSLTKYLEARRKWSADPLERIILGNCPPLPDTWLKKIQDLGSEVITEKDDRVRVMAKSCKTEIYDYDSPRKYSDVDI